MGVMLTDVVRVMRPGHEGDGHRINIADQGIVHSGPTYWTCSCGGAGTIDSLDIRAALDSGEVTRT
jgi:hypothetical protein